MKSSLRSYILNFVVIIGLTAVSLWFALKDNYHEIMHLISSISWYWLLIIFLWGMIYVMILGQIIMIFARRYKGLHVPAGAEQCACRNVFQRDYTKCHGRTVRSGVRI